MLIPLAYYVKRRGLTDSYVTSSAEMNDRLMVRRWVMRSLMKRGVWGSGLDTLITRLREAIRQHGDSHFPSSQIEASMLALGKSLQFENAEIAELTQLKYGAARTFPVLAMLYPGLDLSKSFHEDHIFPRSVFTRARLKKANVPGDVIDEYVDRCDLLPNLQLLGGGANIAKQAKLPADWLAGPHFASEAQRRTYLNDNDLDGLPLTLDKFLEFYDARLRRIEVRLRDLLGVQADEPVVAT